MEILLEYVGEGAEKVQHKDDEHAQQHELQTKQMAHARKHLWPVPTSTGPDLISGWLLHQLNMRECFETLEKNEALGN